MAWTTLINSLFLPGKKILGATGMALRDNLVAVCQALAGAPRIDARAIQNVYLSSGSTSGSGFFTVTGLSAVERLRLEFGLAETASGTRNLEIGFSNDGGSTWGSTQTLCSASVVSGHGGGMITVNLRTGDYAAYVAHSNVLGEGAGTMTVPSNVDAMRVRFGSTGSRRWIANVEEGRT